MTSRIAVVLSALALAATRDSPAVAKPVVEVPFLESAPRLQDFLGMEPSPAFSGKLAKIDGGFLQRDPSDGDPASQRTEVYLGYDRDFLYAIFLAFDSDPSAIRANLSRRENIFDDDIVHLQIDTFLDQRNAYSFICNPLGVQFDALWSELTEFDSSYDTVWYSDGALTDRGYVVWMKVPFKSLRFPESPVQTWGLILNRDIPRNNEESFWPGYTKRIQGRLNQAGLLRGLANISPGKNVQFIPYAVARSFRITEGASAPGGADRVERGDADAGLDAKVVFEDRLVLDATFRPDFSQVESDEPLVTVNKRFEVFFPEKRPFFLENATYFDTPLPLLFTRRIVAPEAGARLTGKLGPYSLGVLASDDEAPGELAPPGDPTHGEKAGIGVVRLDRDLFAQSSLGLLYTDRRFGDETNRVGALDGRFKWNAHWDTRFQFAGSATRKSDGSLVRGDAYEVLVSRTGLHFQSDTSYTDIAEGFRSDLGFIPRRDLRQIDEFAAYTFRPQGRRLINWGPEVFLMHAESQDGTHLEWRVEPGVGFEFRRQTELEAGVSVGREALRPQDCARPLDCVAAGGILEFPIRFLNLEAASSFSESIQLSLQARFGDGVNYVPPSGRAPFAADVVEGSAGFTLRPARRFRIDATFLVSELADPATAGRIFRNDIARLKLSLQLDPRTSLRLIGERDRLVADSALTSLPSFDEVRGDFLFTYLVNPWTAIYAGLLGADEDPDEPLPGGRARQLFVKLSYLFRL